MSKTYSPDQVTAGLQALIEARGNAEEAGRATKIPATTLRTWRSDTYADQYRRLEDAYNHELIEETKSLARSNAKLASDIEKRLLEKIEKAIPNMPVRDAALAAEKIASVKAKSIDKLIALTAHEPGGRTGEPDLDQLLEAMQRKKLIRIRGQDDGEQQEPEAT